jgi:hypothetical protein
MIGEECHQAGNAILRRIGHEGEPADHVAAHHVVDFAARLSVDAHGLITLLAQQGRSDAVSPEAKIRHSSLRIRPQVTAALAARDAIR